MTDPIADFLTRIRNALLVKHEKTVVPASKMKLALAQILKDEGYISDFVHHEEGVQGSISVMMKYDADGTPAIRKLERVSRPGRRHYVGRDEIPKVLNGLGIAILSTSRGVMVGREAARQGVGGEVLCNVY